LSLDQIVDKVLKLKSGDWSMSCSESGTDKFNNAKSKPISVLAPLSENQSGLNENSTSVSAAVDVSLINTDYSSNLEPPTEKLFASPDLDNLKIINDLEFQLNEFKVPRY
jgi:hypothetical protein